MQSLIVEVRGTTVGETCCVSFDVRTQLHAERSKGLRARCRILVGYSIKIGAHSREIDTRRVAKCREDNLLGDKEAPAQWRYFGDRDTVARDNERFSLRNCRCVISRAGIRPV
jgi:hypothetical protein